MRNWKEEVENRVAYIRQMLATSGARGIVYGNSGGKDSALVGILCKMACDNTVGIMLPCQAKQNFGQDMEDAIAVASQHKIETLVVDLTATKESLLAAVDGTAEITATAETNIAPRLRMTALYAIAQSRNSLVAGTGNRSETFMGYFTKWGDGAYDLNPIADLTVTEVYDFLRFLGAPQSILTKAPSAGLFEGQTDEQEMGVTYADIDGYLLHGTEPETLDKILKAHAQTEHKRTMPRTYRSTEQ